MCGLHAGFHLDQSEDGIDSVRVDSANGSTNTSLDQYDDDEDVSASLGAAAAPSVCVATDNQVRELDDDRSHPESHRDAVLSRLESDGVKYAPLIPGSVD